MKPPPRSARETTSRRLATFAEASSRSTEVASEPTDAIPPSHDDINPGKPVFRPTRRQRQEISRRLLLAWRDELHTYAPYTTKTLPTSYEFTGQRFAERIAKRLGPIADGEYLRPPQAHGRMKFIRRAHRKRLGPLNKLREEILETEALVGSTAANNVKLTRTRGIKRLRDRLNVSPSSTHEETDEEEDQVGRKPLRPERYASRRNTPRKTRRTTNEEEEEPISEERGGARYHLRGDRRNGGEDSYTMIASRGQNRSSGSHTTSERHTRRSPRSRGSRHDEPIHTSSEGEEDDSPRDDEITALTPRSRRLKPIAERGVEGEQCAQDSELDDDLNRWEKKKRLIEQLRETAVVLHRVEMHDMVEKVMLRACKLLDEET